MQKKKKRWRHSGICYFNQLPYLQTWIDYFAWQDSKWGRVDPPRFKGKAPRSCDGNLLIRWVAYEPNIFFFHENQTGRSNDPLHLFLRVNPELFNIIKKRRSFYNLTQHPLPHYTTCFSSVTCTSLKILLEVPNLWFHTPKECTESYVLT